MNKFQWFVLAAGIGLTLGLSACSGTPASGGSSDTGGSGGIASSANAAIANMPDLEAELPCSLGGDGANCTSSSSASASLATNGLQSMQDDEDYAPNSTVTMVDFDDVSDVKSSSWLEFRERAGMPEPYATFVDVLRGLAEDEALVEGSIITVPSFELDVGGPPGSGGEGESEPGAASLRPMQETGGKMRVVETDDGYSVYWLLPMMFDQESGTAYVYMKWDIVAFPTEEWLITAQAQIEMDSIIDPAFTFGAWAQFDTRTDSMVIVETGSDTYGEFTQISRSYKDGENTVFVSREAFLSDEYENDYWTVFGWGNDDYGGLANISERTDQRFIYQDFYDQTGSLILEQYGQEWTQEVISEMFCDLDDSCDPEFAQPQLPGAPTPFEITSDVCDFATEVAVSDTDNYANFYIVETWDQENNELDRHLICGFDMTENGERSYTAATHQTLASMDFSSSEPTPVSPSDADIVVGFFWDAYYKGYGETVSASDTWDPGDGRFVTTSWDGPISITFTSGGVTWSDAWLQEFTIMQRVEEPQQLYSDTQYLLNSHFPLKRITPDALEIWKSCTTDSWEGEEWTWCEYFLENNASDDQNGYGEFNWSSDEELGVLADTRLDRVFDWTYYTWDPSTDTESFVTAPFLSTTLPSPASPFVAPSQVSNILAGMQTAYDAVDLDELNSYLDNLTSTTLSENSNYEGLAD